MMVVENEVDRVLTLLRNKIRERGYTQLQVQEALAWGRSYISQLLTKQKSLRVEQVLLILNVIGVDPAEFFAELYYYPRPAGVRPEAFGPSTDEFNHSFQELRSLLRGLVWLLVEREVIDVDELTAAVQEHKDEPILGALMDGGAAN